MRVNLIADRQDAAYRLELAHGFLEEARQDADLSRWRSAAVHAQLAVENAGKTALALFGRAGRTHNPAVWIWRLIAEGQLDAELCECLERLARLAELLGSEIHIRTDYGDEIGGRTPWELFDEAGARTHRALVEAMGWAISAVTSRDARGFFEQLRLPDGGPTAMTAAVRPQRARINPNQKERSLGNYHKEAHRNDQAQSEQR